MKNDGISRREVLNSVGAAGVGALTVGAERAGAAERGEYNVGTASPAAERAARDAADEVIRVLDWDGGEKTITGTFAEEAIDRLDRRPNVRYTEVNGEMHAIDAELDNSWGVDRVDAEVAHNDGETGGDDTDGEGGADIAIIDTGIDDDHPDLDANVGAGKAFIECGSRSSGGPPCSTANCNEPWSDDHDHGTHCAGIADAEDNGKGVVGVSTAATLHAVKVLDCNGSGSYSDVAAGIRHVAEQGWDVGSMSLGGGKSDTVEDACEYAYGEGVLLVAAAGNSGPCSDCVSYPAAEPEVIAVSAIEQDDSLADYSSTGPEVELAAPGSNVYSTVVGGYDTFSGTSMACPHVSGAGGQLMDNGDTNTEARTQLQDTAEDLAGDGSGDNNNEFGYGLLDVEAALGGGELSVDSLSASEVETSDGDAEFDVSWSVSDPDGNLDKVDLVLQDTTAGSQDDSATNDSISGDSASSTTPLVASGDEGSDHSYEVTATVTDTDGNTASETVTTSETEDGPTVDDLSLSEVETGDSDAEFDAEWAVSDADGDLASVDLVLRDLDESDNPEDSKSVGVSSDSASDTTRLVASGEDGSGHTYEVTATVSDTDGTTSSDSATATESESTSSDPTVDTHAITEAGSPNPHLEVTIDWGVSDSDGDLKTVTTSVKDSDGSTFSDSITHSVSGSNASGTDEYKFTHQDGETADVTIYVEDSAGSSDSHTEQVTE